MFNTQLSKIINVQTPNSESYKIIFHFFSFSFLSVFHQSCAYLWQSSNEENVNACACRSLSSLEDEHYVKACLKISFVEIRF
jgi:hypothetical protein